jgi:hypothetical protein
VSVPQPVSTAAVERAAGPHIPGRASDVLGASGPVPAAEQSALLASRIDAAFLAGAGRDPVTWVLTIDPGHPLLGRSVCRAPGCQTTCPAKTRVCLDCRRRLAEAGLALEDYGLLSAPQGARWLGLGDGTCTVPGCPGPGWQPPGRCVLSTTISSSGSVPTRQTSSACLT